MKITIKGKEYPLRFGMLAMQVMSEIVAKFGDVVFTEALIYGGLKNGSLARLEEPDYTFEDVCDFAEDLRSDEDAGAKTIAAINAAFEESKDFQTIKSINAKALNVGEDAKKKTLPRGRKSTHLRSAS